MPGQHNRRLAITSRNLYCHWVGKDVYDRFPARGCRTDCAATPGRIVDATALEDIPRLIRYAWDHALRFPDIGDEIMEDLQSDVQQIVKNERERLTAQYAAAAREAADRIAVKAMRKAEDISAEAITSLLADRPDDGFDPRGCFVYLLWEHKDDQVPVYVGQSTNILSRLGSHLSDPARRHRVRWRTAPSAMRERKTRWR